MNRRALFDVVLFLLLPWIVQPAARADIVTLHDGRWIEGKVEKNEEQVKVQLEHGTVSIPSGMVKDLLIDTDGTLSSKQRKERERIEKAIEETRKHSNWRDRYIKETRHFEFEFNVTEEIAQEYMDLLEEVYKDFTKQLGVRLGAGHKRKKMQINICRDRENFEQIGGVGGGVVGYWNFVDERLFFFNDRNDPEFTLNVLLHEYTHLLTHLIKPKFVMPIWCNEGIAEYFGATKRVDRKLVFGGMQEWRIVNMNSWRQEGNDYTLEQLMRVQRGAFGALEYGWAWSFVHFCMENPKYQKKFMKYYVGLAKASGVNREEGYPYPTVAPNDDIEWFMKCFGTKSLDKLNEEWHDYIDTRLKVNSAAGYLGEAKVLHMEGKYKSAMKAIQKAEDLWEGDPSPLLYHYKGLILKRTGKNAEAAEAFQEAIKHDPLNGRYYYWMGDALEDLGDADRLEEAIRLKNLAREIAPDDYDLRYDVERDELRRNRKKEGKDDEDGEGEETKVRVKEVRIKKQ